MDSAAAFLNGAPPLVGIVSTLRASGEPHSVPVWYRWDGSAVTIWSDGGRAWVRNLRRDPRVGFTVASSEKPYPAAVIRGRAEIVDGDQEPIMEEMRRIAGRYLPESEVDPYLSGYEGPQLIVRVEPDSMNHW